jgi:hypothetical protein
MLAGRVLTGTKAATGSQHASARLLLLLLLLCLHACERLAGVWQRVGYQSFWQLQWVQLLQARAARGQQVAGST